MPLDPTLLRAGQTDYSWISNGVKTGTDYAMTKMHLDQQRQLVQAQLAQHQQQKEMINMQKGMSVFQDIQRAMAETGNVRKTIIDGAKQKAQMFGLPISEDFWAATQNKDYDDKISQAMASLQSPDPDVRDAALSTMSGQVNSATWTKLANISSDTGKQQIAAQKAGQEANYQNKSLDIKGQELAQKRTETLSKDAAGIETKYGGIVDDADEIKSLLAQKTPAGDQAAAQKYTALMGKERITIAALSANTNIGSGVQKAEQMMGKFQTGQLFAPTIRKDILNTVGSLQNSAQGKMKTALSPIVQRAQANPAQNQALLDGQIVPTARLKQLGLTSASTDNDGSDSSDDSDDSGGATQPKLPGNRSPQEQAYLKDAISHGVGVAGMNKMIVGNLKGKPLSPTEAQGWQAYLNPAPPVTDTSDTTDTTDTSDVTAMSGGPDSTPADATGGQ